MGKASFRADFQSEIESSANSNPGNFRKYILPCTVMVLPLSRDEYVAAQTKSLWGMARLMERMRSVSLYKKLLCTKSRGKSGEVSFSPNSQIKCDQIVNTKLKKVITQIM